MSRNSSKLLVIVMTLVAGRVAGQVGAPDVAPRISQADYKKLVAANNAVTIDTRGAEAYQQAHMPGAILLPLEGLLAFPPEFDKTVAMLKAVKKPIVA